jgi:hypothetical protein
LGAREDSEVELGRRPKFEELMESEICKKARGYFNSWIRFVGLETLCGHANIITSP